MNEKYFREILEAVKKGEKTIEEAISELKILPVLELKDVTLDTHRSLRMGFPEVIFTPGKSLHQLKEVIGKMMEYNTNILATRVRSEVAEELLKEFPQLIYNPIARTLRYQIDSTIYGEGTIVIITAGTSDVPVAEEAAETSVAMGNKIEKIYDIGIAGIHRVFNKIEIIKGASVLIVVAGMEGALPSVIGGLVDRPVIGVPTSIGYGANFKGLSALLGMLNSCASNVAVVNIDNGFGAGYIASLINRKKTPVK